MIRFKSLQWTVFLFIVWGLHGHCFAQKSSAGAANRPSSSEGRTSSKATGDNGNNFLGTNKTEAIQTARALGLRSFVHNTASHFPIALFLVSAGGLLLSYFTGRRAESFAFHCLVLATVFSIAATISGWVTLRANANGIFTFETSEEISDVLLYHAWVGTGIPLLAIIVTIMAFSSRRQAKPNAMKYWHLGVYLIALLISWITYLGGELTLGTAIYSRAIRVLFP